MLDPSRELRGCLGEIRRNRHFACQVNIRMSIIAIFSGCAYLVTTLTT